MEIGYLEGGMEIRVEYVCAESAESAECGQLFFLQIAKRQDGIAYLLYNFLLDFS